MILSAQSCTQDVRRGGVSPFVIISIGVFIAALALAVDSASMWHARVELRNGADAATLAAARSLVDDELLTKRPGVMAAVADRAREQAMSFGLANPVLGSPLELDPNLRLDPLGDIVFGYMDKPQGDFQPAIDLTDPHINSVRIIARRTRERGNPAGMLIARFFRMEAADVIATATATLDRDVIGFRPNGNKPLPIAPLALLSDPSLANDDAWEGQVIKPVLSGNLADGVDAFVYDRAKQTFVAVGGQLKVGDGIPEMHVHIPLSGEPSLGEEPNGCFIQIGDTNWDALCRQMNLGVAKGDLAEFDGQFSLGWDNRMYLPGHFQAPGINDRHLRTLLNALKALQLLGEPRIWPIYGAAQNGATGEGVAIIHGFVAARLISAEVATVGEGSDKDPKRQELSLVLQPCMIATGTAITDSGRRQQKTGIDIHNPYICKVRLVE